MECGPSLRALYQGHAAKLLLCTLWAATTTHVPVPMPMPAAFILLVRVAAVPGPLWSRECASEIGVRSGCM